MLIRQKAFRTYLVHDTSLAIVIGIGLGVELVGH
jgi:hypothetical protein